MRINKSITALAVASALSISTAAFAADTGVLRIMVKDSAGNPIPNATVSVSAADTLVSREAETDANGFVRVAGLPPSQIYEVEVVEEGYDGVETDNVRVVSGKTFNLNYTLASVGDDMEKIEVRGAPVSTLDTTSSTTGIAVTLDMTESLPTARNFQDYLQLAPSTKPSLDGNPSSKSGVNYSDIGGE